jgi:branched-chain amino acid transport system permease protein
MEKKGRANDDRRDYRTLLIVSVVILTIPLWARLIPGEVLHMDIVNIMVLTGIYACAVLGLNLLVGYAGQVSLGHAAFFGIGAYTAAILTTRLQWFPSWLGLILAMAVAGFIGYLVGVPVLRLKGNYLAMATLGLGAIASILFSQVKWLTNGNEGIMGIPYLSVFGFKFDSDIKFYFAAWVLVLLIMLFSINMVKSKVGRALRALHSSEVAADAMGVDTGSVKTQVFVLSAALAGLGGALFAYYEQFVSPESFVFTISILFITMVVIGGMGNIWGGLVGVIFLSFLPPVIQALPQWVPGIPSSITNFSNYELVVYGLLLMVFMIFMPRGIAYGLSRGAQLTSRGAKHLQTRMRARKYEEHK